MQMLIRTIPILCRATTKTKYASPKTRQMTQFTKYVGTRRPSRKSTIRTPTENPPDNPMNAIPATRPRLNNPTMNASPNAPITRHVSNKSEISAVPNVLINAAHTVANAFRSTNVAQYQEKVHIA